MSSKLVKSISAVDLCRAFMQSNPALFTAEMIRRLNSKAHWQYIGYHADSLSANLLFECHLAVSTFKTAIVDRTICFGHQFNLGALEALALLEHTVAVHKLMVLLTTDKALGELVAACGKLAAATTVQRGVKPPAMAKAKVAFLLQHTFRSGSGTCFRAAFEEAHSQMDEAASQPASQPRPQPAS